MLKCLSKLVLSMMLGCFVFFAPSIKNHYYRAHIGANVVRVYNMEMSSGGTGFHVKAESGAVYILTNKHVCELADENQKVKIESNGKSVTRKVIKRYAKHDLCLVEPISRDHSSIDIASELNQGEDLIVIGHPGLRKLTLSTGEFIGPELLALSKLVDSPAECLDGVTHEDPFVSMMFGKLICVETFDSGAISAPIYGGNSGSPVVNKYGNVIGVVFAGNRTQAHDSYMVPLKYVKDFLKGM